MDKTEVRSKKDILFDYLIVTNDKNGESVFTLMENTPKEIVDFFPKWKKGMENYRKQTVEVE